MVAVTPQQIKGEGFSPSPSCLMRAAVIHVMADAAVSVLVIVGLLLARASGWLWMDPLAGIIGACVIASWSYGLIRRTFGSDCHGNDESASRP
jgi:Co/Zn/Cd efflux system component